jgi:hypothetical protein
MQYISKQDPTTLNRTVTKDGEPKRSASLPITEYDRALRSHSIGPEDITAIESARNSLNVIDLGHQVRRRAATATSLLFSPPRNRDFGEPAGLSPRPASTHGRGSHHLAPEDNPDEIGMAITSDIPGHRRRSRSLSGLQDAVDNGAGVRKRSDEIRYWRESYDPGFMSPMSSNAPDIDDTGPLDVDPAESLVVDKPKTPPQPFAFGNITSMNQMAGMKITQAASLETRIESMEARMRRMEKVITQLCNTAPNFSVHLDQQQRPAPSVLASDPSFTLTTSTAPGSHGLYRTAPPHDANPPSRPSSSRHSEDSRISFGEAPTYIGSIHHSTTLAPPNVHRPTSNSTVRGATSLPALPREISGPFTVDHYTTLIALIETERSARQALEVQVKKLTHRLEMMSVNTSMPFTGHNSLLDPPMTSKSFSGVSAFDDDDDDEEQQDVSTNRPLQGQDSGIGTGGHDEDDDTYSESFATPREERPHGFGAFGEELRDDDGDGNRKKAARTLSLSQLTVGKGNVQNETATNPPVLTGML